MTDLNTLCSVPGALAAFRYADNGQLVESQIANDTAIDQDTLDLLGHLCVANTAIGQMQARGWEGLSDMNGFYPVKGFTFVGLDWSTVSQDGFAVVMENKAADFDAASKALGG